MNSPVPIIGSLRVWSHESSPLRSPRDSDATPRQWQRAKRVEAQHAGVHTALHQLQRDVNRLRRRSLAGQDPQPFPFEIYCMGGWLEWGVRTGYVVETGAPWVPSNVDTLFTLSAGVLHNYFWLDVDAQTINVSGLSTWSAKKILLGWVDTQTGAASTTATPVNMVDWHIETLCA